MHDPGPFLSAIADHLDHDGPRLVFADWLQDRGEPLGDRLRHDGRWLLDGGRLSWVVGGEAWLCLVDTNQPDLRQPPRVGFGTEYEVTGRSLLLLELASGDGQKR